MKKIYFLLLAIWLLAGYSFAQDEKTLNKQRYDLVKIPDFYKLVSLVENKDCNVKLGNIELFVDSDGNSSIINFDIFNMTGKSISFVEVTFVERSFFFRNRAAKMGSRVFGFGDSSRNAPPVLLPNASVRRIPAENYRISPISDELLGKLKSSEPKIKFFLIGLVTKIIFEDGTVFDDSRRAEGLSEVSF